MSEWKVQVVKVGAQTKHPNADRLLTTRVFDYPVITGVGEFQEGELAVYVPVDSVVPADDPRWAFLQGHLRIKAKRLRGIFSMGLLTKAVDGMKEGEIVAEQLRIIKYEPPPNAATGGEAEKCPFDWPKYTDIESIRRWPDVLKEGEEVILTEKIHGTSARYVFKEGRLWVGSHNEVKKEIPGSVYWSAAKKHDLAKRLEAIPGIAIYGEVYGWVMDLRYGHKPGTVSLALFDAMDLSTNRYLDYDAFEALAKTLEVPIAPGLYRGEWKGSLKAHAEGNSVLLGPEKAVDHIREGFVVKPVKERFDDRIIRVILKYHGEGYLTRKEKD
jgi:RNA ligase (TIGR02306 family)